MKITLKTLPTSSKPNLVVLDVDGVSRSFEVPKGRDADEYVKAYVRGVASEEAAKEDRVSKEAVTAKSTLTFKAGDVLHDTDVK